MSTGTGTGDGQPQHDLLRGLALLTEAVDVLVGASPGWSMADREVRDALVGLDTQAKRVEAARLALVRESVAREQGPHRGRQTRRLLVRRCHATAARAHADVANADLIGVDGDLPGLGAALAAGQVAREHVDVARRCLERIPRHLVTRHGALIDRTLTQHARDWNPRDSAGLAEHVLARLTPDTGDRYDPESVARRHLHTGFDSTGMLLLRGQLDPASGAKFKAVLDHLANLNRALNPPAETCAHEADQADPRQAELDVPDLRTSGQRNADAFSRMVDLAAEHLSLGSVADSDGPRPRAARAVPRIVVTTTPDQLAGVRGAGAATLHAATRHGTLLDHATLTRLSCDAVIDCVVLAPTGKVLEMTTLGRLATNAQITALTARDGGCVWPGCGAPPALCDAHHVTWWSRGGTTTIDNLVLLCSSHHSEIHTEQWRIQMHDGIPWFIPPAHLDPDQRPLRNTLLDAIHHAHHIGDQLGLGLGPSKARSGGVGTAPPERPRWPD